MKQMVMPVMALGMLSAAAPVAATDAMEDVKITAVEVTYMPERITFWVDRAVGTCVAGSILVWNAHGSTQSARDQNAQAVLAALITAKTSGASVRVFIDNVGCEVQFIHLL